MAVIAGQVQVAQGEGGEVVAVQEEFVVREGEKAGQARLERHERILVAVPDEDGNVAVAEHVRVQAVEVEAVPPPPAPDPPPPAPRPQYRPTPAPRRARVTTDRTPLIQQNNQPPRNRRKKYPIHLSGCLFCSMVYILSGAALIGLSSVFVWPCPQLKTAAVSIAAFGVISVTVGVTCCCFVFRTRGHWAILLCVTVGALFILALAAAAVETSYGLVNEHNFYQNATNITGCGRYDENALLPAALVVASYVLLGLLFFYFIGTCLNALTSRDQKPLLYK